MADYPITNVARRVVYTGSAGVGPYAFTFPVLTSTDIAVYKNNTLLTLTTDYTVTISSTTGQGSITLVSAATSSDQITIVGARAIQRSTDFVTGGDFFANTLNTELDSEVIFVQQVAETAERSIKAPVTDPTSINMELPAKASRAGKYLSFNSSTGNPEVVNTVVDVSTVAGIAADITTVAGISADVTTVAGDAADIATIAGIAGNVTTVAGIAANVTTVATNSSNVTTVANDLNEPVSEINTVAVNIANVNTVGNDIASVNTAASNIAAIIAAPTEASNAAASAALANDWATKTTGPVAGGEYSAKYHASAASTSASNANTSASNAASAQAAAESARDATLTAYDNFDDRYLGTKTSDPTLDNDGNALVAGALYFNSSIGGMKVYTGSAWVAAYISGSGYLAAANNLSDLNSASTARTNLGLGTIATYSTSDFASTSGSYSNPAWITALDDGKVLPSMTSNSGKYLTNDGTNSSWATLAVTPTAVSDQTNSSTGYFDLPAGTTAQRPGSPTSGNMRYNSDTNSFEGYNGSAWGSIGGGASAGGAIYENTVTISSNYTLTSSTNGMSVGPITIASGVSVSVGSGQRWVVL